MASGYLFRRNYPNQFQQMEYRKMFSGGMILKSESLTDKNYKSNVHGRFMDQMKTDKLCYDIWEIRTEMQYKTMVIQTVKNEETNKYGEIKRGEVMNCWIRYITDVMSDDEARKALFVAAYLDPYHSSNHHEIEECTCIEFLSGLNGAGIGQVKFVFFSF